MIIELTIIALIFGLIAVGALVYSIQHAPTGYEDSFGFHEGSDPQGDFAFARELPDVGVVTAKVVETASAVRPRRARKSAASEHLPHGTVVSSH